MRPAQFERVVRYFLWEGVGIRNILSVLPADVFEEIAMKVEQDTAIHAARKIQRWWLR